MSDQDSDWNSNSNSKGNDTNIPSIPDDSETAISQWMHSEGGMPLPFTRDIYLERQGIVGMRFQGGAEELVKDLSPGERITFLREPENRFDHRAVMALDAKGRKLGYIPRVENRIISSLMDAGKIFYGIIPESPEDDEPLDDYARTPYVLYVDLYLREYSLPDDLTEIPRQGYRGSYAVLSIKVRGKEITGFCAIKVINGEERGVLLEEAPKRERERKNTGVGTGTETNTDSGLISRKQRLERLWKFVGYLPIVCHDLDQPKRRALEEAYGVLLGIPFSNRVIDTILMARNHMAYKDTYDLHSLADELEIVADDCQGLEKECRLIWQLYRRMERSEL